MNHLEILDIGSVQQIEMPNENDSVPVFLSDKMHSEVLPNQLNEEMIPEQLSTSVQEKINENGDNLQYQQEKSKQLASNPNEIDDFFSEMSNSLGEKENETIIDRWDEMALERLESNLRSLGFSDEEVKQYIDQLQLADTEQIGKQSFGSSYGGMVCWGGSINCSSCYGPLIANSGLCKNG